MRRRLLPLLVLASAAVPLAVPAPAPAAAAVRVETVASGLEVPWDVAFLPDRRALVTERPGRVRLIEADGKLRPEPVATVPTQAEGEGGLMGIAIDPAFASGRAFAYLYVTTASGVELQRWKVAADGTLTRDAVVLDGIAAGPVHDSGRIRFGPDRRLYVLTGDAGNPRLAQQRSSLNGKVLRLSPSQYRSSTNRPTIVSRGHRNPQGLDWQPGSGRLFASEHGPSGNDGPGGYDEINVIRSGVNYQWPNRYGFSQRGAGKPIKVWRNAVAPSGAAFVRRGAWRGDLLVATLRGEALRRLDISGVRVRRDVALFKGRYGRLRAVVPAPDGSVWVTTSNQDGRGVPAAADDRVLRVVVPR
jgi:glucose/arabinose dehydrogenase